MTGGVFTYNSLVVGLPIFTSYKLFCEVCVYGKQHKHKFDKTPTQRAKTPFGIVHIDIYDPILIHSLGGVRYFITFINNFTRKV